MSVNRKAQEFRTTQPAQFSRVCGAAGKEWNVACIKDIPVNREREKWAGKAMGTGMAPALGFCLNGDNEVKRL